MINQIANTTLNLWKSGRKTKQSSSGWISGNAVCCTHNGESADTRGRGGFITSNDGHISYACFNCQFKASYQPGRHLTYKFRKLLSWLGASDAEVKRMVIDAIRVRDLVAPEQIAKTEETEPVTFRSRGLPPGAKSLADLATWYHLQDYNQVPQDLDQAVDYVYKRQIDLTKYDFYWTADTDHNYHRRVIIPLYWSGELIGTTSRVVEDGIKPKYYSDYEPNYVFNVDRQTPEKKFVIVVEGPFDAMAIDGVAIMSNECSEAQADIIDSLAREVIVVPDADRAGVRLIDQAIEYGWSVSFPVWQETCKDANEAVVKYGRLFVLKSILAAKETSRLKIELRKKKLHQ